MRRVAAVLLAILLSHVFSVSPATAQTITNIAQARWTFDQRPYDAVSNQVTIAVDASTASIRTFRPAQGGGIELEFRPALCAGNPTARTPQSLTPPTSVVSSQVEASSVLRAAEDVFFEVNAPAGNIDPAAIDALDATIAGTSGDRVEITIYETGPNTGIFVGRVPTERMATQLNLGDCVLALQTGDVVTVSVSRPGTSDIVVSANVDVLADPFGVVFDSETGDLVSGARVSLLDAVTGQPATVFAEDGQTPWPSTVVSGQAITDGAGRTYAMPPGAFWFPLAPLGRYRLAIEPPDPYTAPSAVSPQQLRALTGPGGRSFTIVDGSFGETFQLLDPTPVEIDIPLDRPGIAVSLTKTASRATAQPGDAVFYTVTVRNQDSGRVKRDVVLVDTPSRWLRLRPDTIRVDGAEAPDAVTTESDGRTLTITLGDIAGGAQRRVTYAMVVRADAPPGDAINEAEATDSLGRASRTNAVVEIARENIAGRMTIIGQVTAGECTMSEKRLPVPGVRVMLEDGSFALTDADGRYHFEGVVPGTHVVQAAGMTLPEGSEFIDCHRSTRSAGSASSRFVTGQGGSLAVADFHATMGDGLVEMLYAARAEEVEEQKKAEGKTENDGSDISWLALGDGPDGFLFPEADHNPRSPSIRVAIRHRAGGKANLFVDGQPVNPLNFDGTRSAPDGGYAVSLWRSVTLTDERTVLSADIVDAAGKVTERITREVYFTTTPTKVELVADQSVLVADGHTNPVIAVRVLDRNGRPLRQGVTGQLRLSAPYQSAEQIARQQLNQLTGNGPSSVRWEVKGADGIAFIELAPTMVSGSLRLDFIFDDGEILREQQLETWLEPGDIEWTVIGLVEGTVGARSVADNMERAGNFDSDLGDDARVALYAKGRVLGKYLVTLAYDSAKQRDDQRLLGTLDPQAYYTVFADASSRQFDAASQEKLYVRIETSTFYALYGDFETGFDQTRLTRYNRTATGVKSEARFGAVQAQGFAAEISTRFRRDEIQGQGISGPYRLSSRAIIANSETVTLEVRDRFRSEQIVETQVLTRFTDYSIDLLSGTITFKRPILSRDSALNPQFIVIDYEIDEMSGGGEFNAGVRVEWTDPSGNVRIGASAITDKGDEARTDIGGLDLRAQIGENTEIRAELALSRSEGDTATGWLVEAEHQTGSLDILAYASSLDTGFGVGQQNNVELGTRKFGVDARARLTQQFSLLGSVWQDDSLTDLGRRRAGELRLAYETRTLDTFLGISHFNDRLADATRNTSTILEGGVTHRLLGNTLELSASSSIALQDAESIDLPARHQFAARYKVTSDVTLVGLYEIADGENIDARTLHGGIELTPWAGGQVVTTIGKQRIAENGERSFAAFGLSQSLQVTPSLTIDATVDGNRTLGGQPPFEDVLNTDHPVASGGQFGPGGSLFEDFTAFTVGGAWRKGRWSVTGRGEYRDGEFANRHGLTFGAIRQLGEGSIVGSGVTWTNSSGPGGVTTEVLDAALAFAHRPADSELAMLGKLEYRSDSVTNAVAGEAGPAGRTALFVNGDALSRRLLASLSTSWSPWDENDEEGEAARRSEFAVFLAGRYNFDRLDGLGLSGTAVLAGADARFGIGENIEIGTVGTLRANLEDELLSYAFGPQVGLVPVDGILLTVGYNIAGFTDEDFADARNTRQGVFAAVKAKFDANTFGALGIGR